MRINKSILRASICLMAALTITLFSTNASAQNRKITVAGTVQFNEPQFKMQIIKQDGPEKIVVGEFDIDANNNFKFEMDVQEAGVYTLDCKKWESIRFWAEDEDVYVNFRGLDTAKMKIKNPPYHLIEKSGPKNELMNHINFVGHQNYQGMIAISQMGYKAKFINDSVKNAFTMQGYDFLSTDMSARINNLVDLYHDRTSAIALLGYLNSKKDALQIEKILTSINKIDPNYPPLVKFVKEKKAAMESQERVKIGSMAPDFMLPSSKKGVSYGPSSFRGKILVIDFWASWCGPCRQEIPHMKEIYEIYKNKGVEFLAVSVDKGTKEWEKAMSQEGMTWPQVIAPNSGKEIMQQYQFSGIPFIILLDKEGRIVAKHLRGENIEKEIEKLLKK